MLELLLRWVVIRFPPARLEATLLVATNLEVIAVSVRVTEGSRTDSLSVPADAVLVPLAMEVLPTFVTRPE